MATSAKECASRDTQQPRWPPSILSKNVCLLSDTFPIFIKQRGDTSGETLRIHNWELHKQILGEKLKRLSEHATMHEVTPKASVALRLLSQEQRSPHIPRQIISSFNHGSIILSTTTKLDCVPVIPRHTKEPLSSEYKVSHLSPITS